MLFYQLNLSQGTDKLSLKTLKDAISSEKAGYVRENAVYNLITSKLRNQLKEGQVIDMRLKSIINGWISPSSTLNTFITRMKLCKSPNGEGFALYVFFNEDHSDFRYSGWSTNIRIPHHWNILTYMKLNTSWENHRNNIRELSELLEDTDTLKSLLKHTRAFRKSAFALDDLLGDLNNYRWKYSRNFIGVKSR